MAIPATIRAIRSADPTLGFIWFSLDVEIEKSGLKHSTNFAAQI
jgi:hypothetical protein